MTQLCLRKVCPLIFHKIYGNVDRFSKFFHQAMRRKVRMRYLGGVYIHNFLINQLVKEF